MFEIDKKYIKWEGEDMPDVDGSRDHLDYMANNLGKYHYCDVHEDQTVLETIRKYWGDDLLLEQLDEDKREYFLKRVQYHADLWEYDYTKMCVNMCLENSDIEKKGLIETYSLDEETFNELYDFLKSD